MRIGFVFIDFSFSYDYEAREYGVRGSTPSTYVKRYMVFMYTYFPEDGGKSELEGLSAFPFM